MEAVVRCCCISVIRGVLNNELNRSWFLDLARQPTAFLVHILEAKYSRQEMVDSSKILKLAVYFVELKHTKKMQRSAKPNGVKRLQPQTNTRAAATWKEGM
jgi:hypothetical protein